MAEPIYSGKVRKIYDTLNQHPVIVTADRISALAFLPIRIHNN
ncbi:MAG: hypothetical protein HDR15_12425 [Lachnospiraceae bacterium]|nr:hypothetical protein [Lachnospiraceae bacterium]